MGGLKIHIISKLEKENAETWSYFLSIRYFLEQPGQAQHKRAVLQYSLEC